MLEDIRKELYVLINEIDTICKKYDITYYAEGGTIIGALRHNGFIPWDDDIDLAILRKDYNRLLDCLKRDNYIIDKDNNIGAIGFELGNSYWPFVKIVNKNIEIIDDFKCDYNLWIDIFPLDNVKNNNKFYFCKLNILRRIYYLKRDELNDIKTNRLKTKIGRVIVKGINFNKFMKYYINYCKKYEKINTVQIAKNVWGRSTACLKDKFTVIDCYFDDVKTCRVEDYDYFLNVLYGDDYMKLPPKEKQITHLFKARYVKDEKK